MGLAGFGTGDPSATIPGHLTVARRQTEGLPERAWRLDQRHKNPCPPRARVLSFGEDSHTAAARPLEKQGQDRRFFGCFRGLPLESPFFATPVIGPLLLAGPPVAWMAGKARWYLEV